MLITSDLNHLTSLDIHIFYSHCLNYFAQVQYAGVRWPYLYSVWFYSMGYVIDWRFWSTFLFEYWKGGSCSCDHYKGIPLVNPLIWPLQGEFWCDLFRLGCGIGAIVHHNNGEVMLAVEEVSLLFIGYGGAFSSHGLKQTPKSLGTS